MLERSTESVRKSAPSSRWERRYAGRLYFPDLVSVVRAVVSAAFIRFGGDDAQRHIPSIRASDLGITYTLVSAIIILAWMLTLGFFDTRDHKIIGAGSTEYKRVADSTIRLF